MGGRSARRHVRPTSQEPTRGSVPKNIRRLAICWLVFASGVAYGLQDDAGIIAGRVVNVVTGAGKGRHRYVAAMR
jgi:hypothetical protein